MTDSDNDVNDDENPDNDSGIAGLKIFGGLIVMISAFSDVGEKFLNFKLLDRLKTLLCRDKICLIDVQDRSENRYCSNFSIVQKD